MIDRHVRFGGVGVPEIASRAHLEALGPRCAARWRPAENSRTLSRPPSVPGSRAPCWWGVWLQPRHIRLLGGAVLCGESSGRLAAGVEHGPLPECVALLVSEDIP